MYKKLFLLSFLICLTINASAAEWKQIGPGGQSILQIVPDRKTPGLWFLTVTGNEPKTAFLSRSVNNGNTWQSTRFTKDVYQVLVHPKSSRVYVLVLHFRTFLAELWVSSDHGKTFQLRTKIPNYFYDRLVLDSVDESRMFRINFGGNSISENGGRTWTALKFPPKYHDCSVHDWGLSDLVVFEGNLYATATAHVLSCNDESGYNDLLLRSSNHGKTWSVLQTLPAYLFHTDVAFPDRVYIYGPNGLWYLSSTKATMVTSIRLDSLVSFPGSPQKLSGWTVGRIVESNDSGATWTEDPQNLSYALGDFQAVNDGMDGRLGGTRAGLFYRNKDHGWVIRNKGLGKGKSEQINSLTQSGSRVYAIIWDWFLLREDGENKPWQNLITQYNLNFNERINRVFSNPRNPDHVILTASPYYGGMSPVVLVSSDGGIHWQRLSINTPVISSFQPGVTFDPIDLNVVYFWNEFGIYKSNDKGVTVEQISDLRNVTQVLIDPNNNQTLFIIADHFYKSTNGGITSNLLAAPPDRRSAEILTALPGRNSFLLATRSGVILRTLDGGQTWQRLSQVDLEPDPELDQCEHQYYCSPSQMWAEDEKHFFVITAAGWFYESTNAGKSWVIKNTNVPHKRIYEMTNPRLKPFYLATDHGVLQHLR